MKLEYSHLPVTVLAFYRPFILAADGPSLHIYEESTLELLLIQQVFDSQVIHGILTYSECSHPILLVWGGSLIRALRVELPCKYSQSCASAHPPSLLLSPITRALDRILDMVFSPAAPYKHQQYCTDSLRGAMITAHNVLLDFQIDYVKEADEVQDSR